MEIKRVDSYTDSRFSRKVLEQHGAFLCEGEAYEVEIIGRREAIIRGPKTEHFPAVIEEFRFFAEHISSFYDTEGRVVARFPEVDLFAVLLEDIQPSQFYADEEKVQAVRSFLHSGEDVIVPLIPWEGRYISLDGHTRLYAAHQMGISKVRGFLSQDEGGCILDFARMARERGIFTPMDLELLSHEDYCRLWHRFCDDYFAAKESQ